MSRSGSFAPNSKQRILVTPARRGKGKQNVSGPEKTTDECRSAMTGAQLRCLFASRPELMGKVPGIVYRAIEEQRVIDKILALLQKKDGLPSRQDALPETRAPPQTSLFG